MLCAGTIPGTNFELPFQCPMDHVYDLEGGLTRQMPADTYGPHIDFREFSFFNNTNVSVCTCSDGASCFHSVVRSVAGTRRHLLDVLHMLLASDVLQRHLAVTRTPVLTSAMVITREVFCMWIAGSRCCQEQQSDSGDLQCWRLNLQRWHSSSTCQGMLPGTDKRYAEVVPKR